MPPHRFNPLSALAGIAVIAVGVLVAVFGFDEVDNEPVIWGAAIAVFAALILLAIPTRLKAPPDDAEDAP
jgi:hypothetical protein